jgi:type VI protein secretion system component Hcp
MAHKIYLKLEGLAGGSKDPRHFGETEITARAWGVSQFLQIITQGSREEGGLARPALNDLVVIKSTDQTTTLLFEAAAQRQFKGGVPATENVSESSVPLSAWTLKPHSLTIVTISSSEGRDTINFAFETAEVQRRKAAG